jgi:hypothetical protein
MTSPGDPACLVATPASAASREDPADDRPEIGSWWWVTDEAAPGSDEDPDTEPDRYDRPGRQWLACVVEVGSNYAKLEGVRREERIALDEFHQRCVTEPAHRAVIDQKVDQHRGRVRELMRQISDLCHRLGVPTRQSLADAVADTPSQALAVAHGVADVQAYGQALARAKDETLPDLFKAVKDQHEQMATWMRAELIPASAELARAEGVTERIEGKIEMVELYAGLTEELVCVREGAPARLDDRVHLLQRRHYMDEECLAHYEAGGMDFQDVAAFDQWLARDEHLHRLLPHPRCVLAFRVRRRDKDYGDTLEPFIKFWRDRKNRKTYLYVRNGEQLWRLETTIDFGESLFPHKEDSDLLGDDELWVIPDKDDIRRGRMLSVVTRRQLDAMVDYHREKRQFAARRLRQWHRAGCPEGGWEYVAGDGDTKFHSEWTVGSRHRQSGRPHGTWHHDDLDRWPHDKYQRLTPENIYHDDVMRRVQRATLEYNRVAVVVQGLLDRSTCLHPHPPWRIWTAEGFTAGVELVYDVSRAVTPGPAPDFEEYRRQLNRSLRAGCHTIGQAHAWHAEMERRLGSKWRQHVAGGYGNDGPAVVHPIDRVRRDGTCEFSWTRQRMRPKWAPDPDRPGYQTPSYPPIPVRWTCSPDHLTCVDAYTPGDFHLFYDDPRTRADYLRWAPILLACEDWHHARRQAQVDEAKTKSTSKRRRKRKP